MDAHVLQSATAGALAVFAAVLLSLACDDPNRHVERISGTSAEFVIVVPGTADHRRMGGWHDDPGLAHNSTRYLRISNHGDRPVINPHVVVEGGPDWFDMSHIVAEFVRPGMTDEEKSFALWQWVRHNMSDGPTYDAPLWGDTRSMTRFMNLCGTGACGTYHTVMPVIGKHAGLRSWGGCFADCSHAVQHQFFDGQKRFLDAHIPHESGQPGGWYALKLDNREIAGVEEIMQDRYLIDRAGAGPERLSYVAYFGPGCSFSELKDRPDPHTMALTLRPGEAITWYWEMIKPPWKEGEAVVESDRCGSGSIEYRPDPKEWADSSEVQWECPYPMTGAGVSGTFAIEPGGRASIEMSFDGRQYARLWTSDQPGEHELQIDAADDPRFHEPEFTHRLWFRVILDKARVHTDRLTFRGDFHAYRLSLPSLFAGRNVIRYTGTPDRSAELTSRINQSAELGLINGGFEVDALQGGIPTGWTAYGRTDGLHLGDWYAGTRPLQGRSMFTAAANWDAKTGGIYQRVRWTGGRIVRAGIHLNTRGDTTESSGGRIGIDPTGGTDPQSERIQWSPLTRTNDWQPVETPDVTTANAEGHVTVFIEHCHAGDGERFNLTAFDACTLMDVEAGIPREGAFKDDVHVEYGWRDLPDLPVPQSPAKPVHPLDGGRFGFNERMEWAPAAVGGDAGIASYEVYISSRPDLAWPVMPNTHRITHRAEPTFSLVFPDVLRHGATYYWRVRGQSDAGVWGDWSPTWSFVAAGPGAPRDLKATCDDSSGDATLTWKPPGEGTPVDYYEVYASGEHGFSPLREAEEADILEHPYHRPATLLDVTASTTWTARARTEKFYRIIAADADGNRGVPTPILELPSPCLLPVPELTATACEPLAARLPARLRTGRPAWSLKEGMIIDGADTPTFALAGQEIPPWLTIDALTGVLRGTLPASAGGDLTITVTLDDGNGGRCRRDYSLAIKAAN